MSDRNLGLLLAISSAFGYGLLPVVTKGIYQNSDLEALDLATWRFIFTVPLIWIWVRARGIHARKDLPLSEIIRFFGLGIVFSFAALSAFFALNYIPASLYVSILYTYPGIIAIVLWLRGKAMPPMAWFALALTIIGVFLMIDDWAIFQSADFIGVAAAFFNAIIVVISFLLNERLMQGRSVIRSSALITTGALLVFLLISLFRDLSIPQNLQTWLYILFLALCCTVFPVVTINLAIQKIGSSSAAIVSSIEPFFGIILAVIFLSETILPLQWLGALLIICSIYILHRSNKPIPIERIFES
ncbi:DMT family transporter [Anaerolineales bacterium]